MILRGFSPDCGEKRICCIKVLRAVSRLIQATRNHAPLRAKLHPGQWGGGTELTQARLKKLLRYELKTGEFFWRVAKSRRVQIGDRAGWISRYGYWLIYVDDKTYCAHRLAWLYAYGQFPNRWLDHKDRNRSNNRIVNLREATPSQSAANSKIQNRTGLRGVHQSGRRWQARICHRGKRTHLGMFDLPEEAHAAWCEAAQKLFGEYFYSGKD